MRVFGNTNLETIRILILHVNMRTSLFGDIEFWNIDFEFAVNELPWVFTPAVAFWQCNSVCEDPSYLEVHGTILGFN